MLIAVGAPLVVVAAPNMVREVVYEGTFVPSEARDPLGPVHLEEGEYAIWIEDVHPGFDDGRWFAPQFSGIDTYASPATYRTREFDGTDCELNWLIDIETEADYTFEIAANPDFNPVRPIHLYLTTDPPDWATLLLAPGTLLVIVGSVLAVFTYKKQARQGQRATSDLKGPPRGRTGDRELQ